MGVIVSRYRRSAENGINHALRACVVLLMIAAYLISGLLHVSHEFDLEQSSGRSTVKILAVASDAAERSKHGVITSHHCHGCFSVSAPSQPEALPGAREPRDVLLGWLDIPLVDRSRGLDPPPPKLLI